MKLQNITTSILLAICMLASVVCKAQATTKENPVQVNLISDVSTFEPGKPFTVGVAIHHHEHFHTYWHSPGTVGLATMVNWELPEGFTVGELTWPVPERCKMEGYNTHGYERDVILLTTVTPPKSYTGKANLSASITWMACSVGKCCNVQNTSKNLILESGPKQITNAASAKRIADTRAAYAPASPSATATFVQAREEFTLTISFADTDTATLPDPDTIYFYPKGMAVDSIRKQIVARTPTGYKLTLPRTEFAPPTLEQLEGLLHSNKGWPTIKGNHLKITAKPKK